METGSEHRMPLEALGEERGDEVAAIMGRAFQDDPLFALACPDPGERACWLPWLFRWSTWKGVLFGQILGSEEPLGGVMALIGPGGGDFTEEDLARFGYGRGREVVGAQVWDRALAVVNAAFEPLDAALHHAVPAPHWYLDVIAVEPTRQSRGIGSRLLQAAAARADADGVPIVLLTYQPKSLPLYQRHGYAVVCEGAVAGSEVRGWCMRSPDGRSIAPLETGSMQPLTSSDGRESRLSAQRRRRC
jgi:GNAT superfamily N-acetyltransferase